MEESQEIELLRRDSSESHEESALSNSGGIIPSARPKLSLLDSVCLLIGNIIGSGIFISPRSVLSFSGTPSATLLNWTFAGMIASIGALW